MNRNSDATYSGRHSFCQMDEREMFDAATRKMEHEKRFLDPYLTLETLAGEMNVRRNALSASVNRYGGANFPRWLSGFRIGEVERLASESATGKYNLSELARQSGFADYASFYRVFRAIRKASPSSLLKLPTSQGSTQKQQKTK